MLILGLQIETSITRPAWLILIRCPPPAITVMIHIFDCSDTDHPETQEVAWRAPEKSQNQLGQLLITLPASILYLFWDFLHLCSNLQHTPPAILTSCTCYCRKGFCRRLKNNFKTHTILIIFKKL